MPGSQVQDGNPVGAEGFWVVGRAGLQAGQAWESSLSAWGQLYDLDKGCHFAEPQVSCL